MSYSLTLIKICKCVFHWPVTKAELSIAQLYYLVISYTLCFFFPGRHSLFLDFSRRNFFFPPSGFYLDAASSLALFVRSWWQNEICKHGLPPFFRLLSPHKHCEPSASFYVTILFGQNGGGGAAQRPFRGKSKKIIKFFNFG